MAKVKGIAFWASVQEPNTMYDPEWCIDVLVDKATGKGLKAQGLKVKPVDTDKYGEDYEGMGVVKIKRGVTTKKGKANDAPRIVDSSKQPFSGLIGNGSKVNVLYDLYDWTYKQSSGISADLKAVQVLELVEYVGKEDNEDFEEEEGFESNNTNNNKEEDFDDDEDPFDK